jgi:hypothetical protein
MRTIVAVIAVSLLAGCASDIKITTQPYRLDEGSLLARVKMNDLRAAGVAASKREAAFGVPMGNISFDPSEGQLVKSLLEVELSKFLRLQGVKAVQDFSCDILEFGVNTNTTPLYWDVVGRVRIVLRSGTNQATLIGTHTARTFVWPGEDIIRTVVDQSLSQVAAEVHRAAKGL